MKQVFTILAVALLFSLSLTTHAQKGRSKEGVQTAMQDNSDLPYTAMYSSKFQMGDIVFRYYEFNSILSSLLSSFFK